MNGNPLERGVGLAADRQVTIVDSVLLHGADRRCVFALLISFASVLVYRQSDEELIGMSFDRELP